MGRQKHINAKAFFLAFLLSMAVLGVASTGIMAFTGLFSPSEPSPQSVAGEPEYRPVEGDRLTILVMCCKDDTQPPDRYTLLRFFPEERVFRVVPIPPELEATVNIETGTLPQLYDYGGVQMVCRGVENAFFIQVDRYLKCSEKALSGLIDQVGGIEYQVEQTVEYQAEGTGETVRLVEGLQLLSGKKTLEYLASPLVSELPESAKLEKQAVFIKAGLEQRFSEGILARTDELFSLLSNTMQTNLTNYDYVTRKEAIRFLARIDEEKVVFRQIEGSYREERDGKRFTPSADGKAMMQEWFEMAEE